MNRLLAALVVGLAAGVALADVAPPTDVKDIPIDYRITTDAEIPGWRFFTVIGPDRVTPVTLAPDSPVLIDGSDRPAPYTYGFFTAVPTDAAKRYATEKEFHDAVKDSKVPGQVLAKTPLGAFAVSSKDTDPRNGIVMEYALKKIDGKEIVLELSKDSPKPRAVIGGDSPEGGSEAPKDRPSARRAGWIAGLAALAALLLGGLWLASRARRKVV
jgi:hypothetical protein